MSPSEPPSETLCTACGLCCDGSSFNVVVLRPEELESARRLKLRVVSSNDGRIGIKQPCSAFRGHRCDVYAERPDRCAAFRCQLLSGVEAGTIPLAQALAIVSNIRTRHGRIEAALPPADAADPSSLRVRAWQQNAVEELPQHVLQDIMMVEGLIAQHF